MEAHSSSNSEFFTASMRLLLIFDVDLLQTDRSEARRE